MSSQNQTYVSSVSALLDELRTISDVPDGLSEANYAYRLGYVHGIAKIAAATLGNASDGFGSGSGNGGSGGMFSGNGDDGESWRRKGL